jgi:hypothetical protein
MGIGQQRSVATVGNMNAWNFTPIYDPIVQSRTQSATPIPADHRRTFQIAQTTSPQRGTPPHHSENSHLGTLDYQDN